MVYPIETIIKFWKKRGIISYISKKGRNKESTDKKSVLKIFICKELERRIRSFYNINMNKRTIRQLNRRYERAKRIKRIKKTLEEDGRFEMLKNFRQHGNTSVHNHVSNVAWWALTLADNLPLKFKLDELTRASLLHDYFLYDWHDKHEFRPHGFTHPYTAVKNAKEDFDLTEVEEDAIKKHMFPLIPLPPKHKEGWLVTIADKIATFEETLGRQRKSKRKYASLAKKTK